MNSDKVTSDKVTVGIVGGGPWGVALALAASRTGADVLLLTRREHPQINDGPQVTQDYAMLARAQLLVVAVPSNAARAALRALGDHLDGSHFVIHGVRGLVGDALQTISDLVREETPVRRVGALGGPVQADELTRGRPSAMVVGSRFPEVLSVANMAFQSNWLRIYSTPDIRGLEWASALVGCLSIGVGFAEQAGAGPGLLAALISRGVDEAARIAVAAGADDKTMLGLGGYGDLLASIALESRPEVIVGKALARGHSVEEAMVQARLRVEAIALIPRIVAFAKQRKVQAGMFEALAGLLQGGPPQVIVERMFAA